MSKVIVFLWLIIAVGVSGQEILHPNTVGLYTDPEFHSNCIQGDLEYPLMVDVYIVAHELECNHGLVGWELSIQGSGGLIPVGGAMSYSGVNYASFPNFLVGLPVAAPVVGDMVLSSMSIYASAPGAVSILPADPSSIPAPFSSPAYICSDDVFTIVPMLALYGGNGEPSLVIGLDECPVMNEFAGGIVESRSKSLSAVKLFFR